MFKRLLLCIAALSWALSGHAQNYPDQPITFVVPQPPGGSLDATARALGEEMGRRLGTTIIVDNKPGASGMLGASTVVRAKPDGYTLFVTNSTPILTLPHMFDKVPYEPSRDLQFITQISGGPLVLVINADIPARNMQEFLAWAGQNKGKISYGSFGIGTSGHLMAAHLNRSRDLNMTHIPMRGEAPLVQELLSGRVAWAITTTAVAPHLQSGRLRALAVVSDRRVKELPTIPTMPEAGLKDPEFKPIGWFALMAPAGVPAALIQRLEKEAREAIRSPGMQARIQGMGMDPIGNSSAEFRKEYELLAPVVERMVKISGAKME